MENKEPIRKNKDKNKANKQDYTTSKIAHIKSGSGTLRLDRTDSKTERPEEKREAQKKKYISERKERLNQLLLIHKLVPFRCVLSQVGRENVVLNSVPTHFEVIQPFLKTLNNCSLNGRILRLFADNGCFIRTKNLQLEDNSITDTDSGTLAVLLKKGLVLTSMSLKGNKLESKGCREFSAQIGNHKRLERVNLSWNHIRRDTAIDIAKSIQENESLKVIDLSWNGFGYEGCSALSDALEDNKYLIKLDLRNNRIHPPALLELMRGLSNNSTLQILNLSNNPITPAVTTIFLEALFDTNYTGLKELHMKSVVVDCGFPAVVRRIQQHRPLEVYYERALPYHARPEKLRMELQAPSIFNMDPLKLLYLLKEKNRAQDFFNKINKDNNDVLTVDEIQALFREMGVSVTKSVVDKIMDFMDTDQSGSIDLGEFLDADKRIRKMSRDQARSSATREGYNKYSRSFARGQLDPMTFQLRIQEPKQLLPPIKSREPSISPVHMKEK